MLSSSASCRISSCSCFSHSFIRLVSLSIFFINSRAVLRRYSIHSRFPSYSANSALPDTIFTYSHALACCSTQVCSFLSSSLAVFSISSLPVLGSMPSISPTYAIALCFFWAASILSIISCNASVWSFSVCSFSACESNNSRNALLSASAYSLCFFKASSKAALSL